jgi:hypothetical protein
LKGVSQGSDCPWVEQAAGTSNLHHYFVS